MYVAGGYISHSLRSTGLPDVYMEDEFEHSA